MARVVESVVPDFWESVRWRTVVTKELQGAKRYAELSKNLGKPAPVPSIFIEGELIFEMTPSQEQLREYLNRILRNG